MVFWHQRMWANTKYSTNVVFNKTEVLFWHSINVEANQSEETPPMWNLAEMKQFWCSVCRETLGRFFGCCPITRGCPAWHLFATCHLQSDGEWFCLTRWEHSPQMQLLGEPQTPLCCGSALHQWPWIPSLRAAPAGPTDVPPGPCWHCSHWLHLTPCAAVTGACFPRPLAAQELCPEPEIRA